MFIVSPVYLRRFDVSFGKHVPSKDFYLANAKYFANGNETTGPLGRKATRISTSYGLLTSVYTSHYKIVYSNDRETKTRNILNCFLGRAKKSQ